MLYLLPPTVPHEMIGMKEWESKTIQLIRAKKCLKKPIYKCKKVDRRENSEFKIMWCQNEQRRYKRNHQGQLQEMKRRKKHKFNNTERISKILEVNSAAVLSHAGQS